MIARLRILLPFKFYIPENQTLEEIDLEIVDSRIKIYPPFQCNVDHDSVIGLSSQDINRVISNLSVIQSPKSSEIVRVEGIPTFEANLLQLDLSRESFNRENDNRSFLVEDFLFEIVNDFLGKISVLTKGVKVKPMDRKNVVFSLDYLNDDGTELLIDPQYYRTSFGVPKRVVLTALNQEIWNKARELPVRYEVPTWFKLNLSSEELSSEIGPSVVLAFSSLETMIYHALNILAQEKGIPKDLWSWVNNRHDARTNPSVAEQFDSLLKSVVGKSLKEEPVLWETFQNLKNARNKFVHEGVARIHDQVVTKDMLYELNARTKFIIAWLENLLPLAYHLPKLDRLPKLNIVIPLISHQGVNSNEEETKFENKDLN